MIDDLNNIFKRYVAIFLQEYGNYLSKEQLELLKDINFNNAVKLVKTNKPFGFIALGQVNLSDYSEELINNLKKMPNYNSNSNTLKNKTISSYLRYMCENGYNVQDYYNDILMYFVFKLVIKNNNGLINGFINQEMKYLSKKYSLRIASLYPKEEVIAAKITPIIGMNRCRRIIFLDSASSFKFLNDTLGFRVANFIDNVGKLIEKEYSKVSNKEYIGYDGFLDYAYLYDRIAYGNVLNYLLDYEVRNDTMQQY